MIESELEALEELAEAFAFSNSKVRIWSAPPKGPPATHCRNGHPMTEANTRYRRKGNRLVRCCQQCARLRRDRSRNRKRKEKA